MKFKSIIVALFFVFALTSTAQAQLSVGGGLSLPLDQGDLGIFGRGVYQFDDTWGGQGTFTYYLVGEGLTFWSLDFDATYGLIDQGSLIVYALAGLSFYSGSVDLGPFGSASVTDTGVSLGGGAKLPSGNITPFGEVRLRIAGGTDLILTAGVLFPLN